MIWLSKVTMPPADPDRKATAERMVAIMRGATPEIVVARTETGYEVIEGLADAFACLGMGKKAGCTVRNSPKVKRLTYRCRHCGGKGYSEPVKPQNGHLLNPEWKAAHQVGMNLLLEDITRNLNLIESGTENTGS